MRLTTLSLIALLSATLLIGCGVKKEEHAKVQQDLANTQAAFAAKEQELTQCEENFDKCSADLKLNEERLQVCMANSSKTEEELKNLDAEYAETWAQLQALKKANDLRQKAMDELLQKFEQLIKSGKLSIGVNDGRMVIQLSSDVLFPVGKSKLSKEGKEAVKQVVEVLSTIEGRKFQIAGHTDDTRGRGANPNWTLSYNRARSVFDVMVKDGMDESLLSLAAYAEYSPVVENTDKESRKQNRRIEIVLLPTSDELPLKQLSKIKQVEKNIDTK